MVPSIKETQFTLQHSLQFSNLTVTIHTSVTVTCVYGKDVKFNHYLSGKLETQRASL